MTLADETVPPTGNGKGARWALVPVALLLASTLGVGSMASVAARDPGFALEKDYYARAIHWDGEQAQQAENQRLRYELALSTLPTDGGVELVVSLAEPGGKPLTGATLRAEAFANARSAARSDLVFVEAAPGKYRVAVPAPRAGLWELRFVVTRGGERFSQTVRQELVATGTTP
jgi:hypothetical protein